MSLPKASHVRQQFLDFFASKGHHIVPSAPLVLKDDPTLLFVNSGMAPFKDYFLGNKPAPYKRVADTQKCLRVSGKHNDLEEVGYDTYHQTLFEMLGNWSFGDYFKTEAIAWAWELLTEVYKLPKDRLYVTYFQGDEGDKLAADTETQNLWRQYTTEDRILPGNKKDNFWEMGDTGPCGPCTEIHIDLRSDEEVAQKPGRELVNADHPQVVEIWNNVFMEFQRLADKSLIKLPAQHVDTGMGFERLMMAVSGVKSNYDTDVFQPLIQFIAKEAGIEYHGTAPATVNDQPATENEKTDIAIRVIADHIRAISFTIADGQLPSNVKAGYVIRRILRRAVRYAFSSLNQKQPFLYKLVPVLADQMASIFPELKAQQQFVQRVIEEEEISFLKTLEKGSQRIHSLILNMFKEHVSRVTLHPKDSEGKAMSFTPKEIKELKEAIIDQYDSDLAKNLHVAATSSAPVNFQQAMSDYHFAIGTFKNHSADYKIDGKTAFELSDTFGFPLDLTALIARENGLTVDEAGFQKELEAQKNRSRNAQESEQSDWVVVNSDNGELSVFVGYDVEEAPARLLRYRKVTQKGKTEYHVVLDQTPFYAESGGQVGDTGYLEGGLSRVRVIDTKKENDLIVHTVLELPLPEDLEGEFTARIDQSRRALIRKNHTATHLLQAALRRVLGEHVQQKGSLVNDKLLRFDFSHFTKVTDEQLREIEQIVNERIRQQIPLDERRNVPIAEAKTLGAMALFGEKYGDFVRVITFDKDYSVELCGGIHVRATGEIGFFKITSESAVGAGVRRIEAVTADVAEAYVDQQLDLLRQVRELLGNPQHLLPSLQKVGEENAALRKQLEQAENQQLSQLRDQLAAQAKPVGGVQLIAAQVPARSADALKKLAYDLRQVVPNLVAVLGADIDGKPQLAVILDDEIAKAGKLNAKTLIGTLAKEIQGGGGGQPFFATAGGKNVAGLPAAIGKAEELVGQALA
ncbi:alanine--tRNA ligase [Hymenobacter aerilatus]|uniref:Alanine--tRNA ligase n=1 Tax=Hymenobacter aerilatus TaxID=2932251 RepID=A0A8T9T2M4_9BACT|nr:alanine--tRNA ligase [Hymenobacter aerilatus]UOR06830.1 alanine--tRNA ligase [Hymenobacter aerilatus]